MAQRKSGKSKLERSKLEKFISKVNQDVLECPHMVINLKNDYAKMKPYLEYRDSLSKSGQYWMNLYERACCGKYNIMSISNKINITQACQDIKETINYVESEVNQSTKHSLILIGESHSSVESFLIEISVLSYLKQKKLANKVLIEFDTNGVIFYKKHHISEFAALDARHFAYDVLNYDLIGFDKYYAYNGENYVYSGEHDVYSGRLK